MEEDNTIDAFNIQELLNNIKEEEEEEETKQPKRGDRIEIIDNVNALKRARSLSTSSKTSNHGNEVINNVVDLPMAQRLAALTNRLNGLKERKNAFSSSSASSSLTAALEQALKSSDKEKLESVLQCNNLDVIKNTVR